VEVKDEKALKKLKIFKNRHGELISNAYAAGEVVHFLDDEQAHGKIEQPQEEEKKDDINHSTGYPNLNQSLGPLPPLNASLKN